MASINLRDFDHHFRDKIGPPAKDGGNWLVDLRNRALQDFKDQGMPTVKTEEWKYTSLTGILKENFAEADTRALVEVPRVLAGRAVVVVNGEMKPELSRMHPDGGVTIRGLNDVLVNNPESIKTEFGHMVSHERHPFAAMNSAAFTDGLVIDVRPGAIVDEPLVIVWLVAGAQQALIQPRLFLRLGEGSQLKLIEQHMGSQTPHLVNQVSEIDVGANARLTHIQMQQSGRSRLIHGAHVRCQRDSSYRSQSLDMASSFVRNDLVVSLAGTGAEADVDGLFLASHGEQVDNHLRVDHLVPHCRSHALYKGLLGHRGHGVFNGKLIVHPGADKTDARQENHNLLLSTKVSINSKPELEIYTDDVKCSHGSTTGELDPDQLFYMLTRGIDRLDAQSLLVGAFAREVRDRLPLGAFNSLVDAPLERALAAVAATQEEQCRP